MLADTIAYECRRCGGWWLRPLYPASSVVCGHEHKPGECCHMGERPSEAPPGHERRPPGKWTAV